MQLKTLRVSLLSNIPDDVRDHLKMMLNVEPTLRPDADQLSKVCCFLPLPRKIFITQRLSVCLSYTYSLRFNGQFLQVNLV